MGLVLPASTAEQARARGKERQLVRGDGERGVAGMARREARPCGIRIAPSVQTIRKPVAMAKVSVNPVTVGYLPCTWSAMKVAESCPPSAPPIVRMTVF